MPLPLVKRILATDESSASVAEFFECKSLVAGSGLQDAIESGKVRAFGNQLPPLDRLPFGEEKFHERAAAFLSRGFLFCLCFLSLYFCLCLSARARGIAVC